MINSYDSENVLNVSDVDGEDVGDDDDGHEERHGEGDLKIIKEDPVVGSTTGSSRTLKSAFLYSGSSI